MATNLKMTQNNECLTYNFGMESAENQGLITPQEIPVIQISDNQEAAPRTSWTQYNQAVIEKRPVRRIIIDRVFIDERSLDYDGSAKSYVREVIGREEIELLRPQQEILADKGLSDSQPVSISESVGSEFDSKDESDSKSDSDSTLERKPISPSSPSLIFILA